MHYVGHKNKNIKNQNEIALEVYELFQIFVGYLDATVAISNFTVHSNEVNFFDSSNACKLSFREKKNFRNASAHCKTVDGTKRSIY